MQTIFDFNVTAEEREQLGDTETTREEYEAICDQQSAYVDLYCLMGLRDDKAAQARFYDLVDDKHYMDMNVALHDLDFNLA